MTKAAILAALLVPAGLARAAAPAGALDVLREAFSDGGVETLASRGVLVLQGKGTRRLAAVHWKALDALVDASTSCLAFADAADGLARAEAARSPDLGFSACRALTPDGLMTPSLHALAAELQSRNEELWALRGGTEAPTAARPNAFDTSWGQELVHRRRADMLENPAPLIRPLFDELLAGPRPNRDAAALLAGAAAARGVSAPEIALASDAAHGALSEELRAQIRRTLSDDRRRWSAQRSRAQAARLLAASSVKRELEDLRSVAKVLAARLDLTAALEAASSAPGPGQGARLRSAGLHLQEPTRLGQHELADDAIVSGAYWVDGLPEGSSVDVEETVVVETERGFLAPQTRTVRRKNGGPYPYARALKIEQTMPFTVRSLVSSENAALEERVEVPVARDFELALLKESQANGLRAACRLKDAEGAFSALEALVADAAKVKPQYDEIRWRAQKSRRAVQSEMEIQARLEEVLIAARADSAPQRCRYETSRVDEALRLARRLPPGCDRDLPEILTLRATIARRAADQAWFLRASAQARSRRRSCDLEAAAQRWSEALGVLDADPGARCGRVEDEAAKAKAEMLESSRESQWVVALDSALAAAEAKPSPAERLAALRPITSRLGFMDGDCLRKISRRAAKLTKAASSDLPSPPDGELARMMPPETNLVSTMAEIRRDRAVRLAALTEPERSASPPAAAVPAAPAPATPAPEKKAAPVKPKPAKSKKQPEKAQP